MKVVKNVAAIHDLSGLGRSSLTAAIPIISVIGVQVCPFPTAILSCQTGYSSFSFLDLTDEMKKYSDSWREMKFKFDGIYSGFLGSEDQIEIVESFIKTQEKSFVLVDPVMGDNGVIYKTYTETMCNKMKELVKIADVVTPNITEACILTGRDYNSFDFSTEELRNISREIAELGPKKIVITGIINDSKVCNYAYDKINDKSFMTEVERLPKSFAGTGDIFASILCGSLMQEFDFEAAVNKAAKFIYEAIKYSMQFNVDPKNGVIFEPLLGELMVKNE